MSRGQSQFKDTLKSLRAWPPLNHFLTTSLKLLLANNPPEGVVQHVPRVGTVQVTLPNGRSVKLWSRADDWITSRLWWRGIAGYEAESIVHFLRFAETARVIFDIGAYTGYYALVAAAINPSARVFAFEPHARVASRIGMNLSLNPDLEVTVVPCAVANFRGPVDFYVGGPALPSSSSLGGEWRGRHQTRRVAAIDIDSFCEDWDIERVDLVKIDVESREPEVIEGMRRVLERDRPIIVAEVLSSDVPRYRDMQGWLEGHDYVFFVLTPNGPLRTTSIGTYVSNDEAVPSTRNHLLCPAEKLPAAW